MGKKIVLVALLSCGLTGCGMIEKKTECGFLFQVYSPPVIHTGTPVLVSPPSGDLSAHPVGTVAGPVTSGQFNHGPMVPQAMQRQSGTCGDALEMGKPRLTCEEWERIMQTSRGQAMPAVNTTSTPAR